MSTAEMKTKVGQRPSEEDRRNTIHVAALNAFIKNGYAGASMASIARTVGGSKTTLYCRYPSKKALFLDVVCRELDCCFASISRFSSHEWNVEQALYNHCLNFAKVAQSESTKSFCRLVMSECLRQPEIQSEYCVRVNQYLVMLGAAIEETIGRCPPSPLDWDSAARLLFDLNMNFLYQQLHDSGISRDTSAVQEEHANYVVGMLLPALAAERDNRR